jgi:hypothetical protein
VNRETEGGLPVLEAGNCHLAFRSKTDFNGSFEA